MNNFLIAAGIVDRISNMTNAEWEALYEDTLGRIVNAFLYAQELQGGRYTTLGRPNLMYGRISWQLMALLIASFVILIYASDSFSIDFYFNGVKGVKTWFKKLWLIIRVYIFSVAIYSLNFFYTMLVALIGPALNADASVMVLKCLGGFINPISIMFLAFAVATMPFGRTHQKIQAGFLGAAVFVVPAILIYRGINEETFYVYLVAIVLSVAGGILCKKYAPFITYFIMMIIYLISKYLIVYFSRAVYMLTAYSWWEKILQYLVCEKMDIIMGLLLLVLLWGYSLVITDPVNIKKGVVFPILTALLCIGSVGASYAVTVDGIELDWKAYEQTSTKPVEEEEEEEEEPEPIPAFVITASAANIRTGPGTQYGVIIVADGGTVFAWTGNSETLSSGSTWYELYLDPLAEGTGWASETVMEYIEYIPGESEEDQ